ncbi:helix-turn-helix domain-containing protein [Dactylosporangium vinaceum]|uniref:Helix-turn-helix domain-containing protein n=1 Tax=Dactylosporangium vinaceum TaxID=53362 RepID=A0ABV5MLK7_9ACTN|nr:helix-turn-helix domain-containing protein [Dactylosporangium vinaceum]UAB96932.1 helix-turn-helix domain-containing protein [Dactylosporangium vinaceum]
MAIDVPGAAILLTAQDCALIDRALRLGLTQLAARNGGGSAGVEQVAAAVLRAAADWRAQHLRSSGSTGAQASAADAAPPAELTAQDAAAHLGCTVSTVRRMAEDGRLSARRTPAGTWAIDSASVAVLAQQRAAQRAA